MDTKDDCISYGPVFCLLPQCPSHKCHCSQAFCPGPWSVFTLFSFWPSKCGYPLRDSTRSMYWQFPSLCFQPWPSLLCLRPEFKCPLRASNYLSSGHCKHIPVVPTQAVPWFPTQQWQCYPNRSQENGPHPDFPLTAHQSPALWILSSITSWIYWPSPLPFHIILI